MRILTLRFCKKDQTIFSSFERTQNISIKSSYKKAISFFENFSNYRLLLQKAKFSFSKETLKWLLYFQFHNMANTTALQEVQKFKIIFVTDGGNMKAIVFVLGNFFQAGLTFARKALSYITRVH